MMHGLHDRAGEHRCDAVGEPIRAVADEEEHIAHAPVLDLGEDTQPVLGRLPTAGAGPDPQRVLVAVEVDPDRG